MAFNFELSLGFSENAHNMEQFIYFVCILYAFQDFTEYYRRELPKGKYILTDLVASLGLSKTESSVS